MGNQCHQLKKKKQYGLGYNDFPKLSRNNVSWFFFVDVSRQTRFFRFKYFTNSCKYFGQNLDVLKTKDLCFCELFALKSDPDQ